MHLRLRAAQSVLKRGLKLNGRGPWAYPQQPGGIRTPVIDRFSASLMLHRSPPPNLRFFPAESAYSDLYTLYIAPHQSGEAVHRLLSPSSPSASARFYAFRPGRATMSGVQ